LFSVKERRPTMTIEEIQAAISDIERDMNVTTDEFEDNLALVNKGALDTALAALREAEERRQGCEFCRRFDFSGASAEVTNGKHAHVSLAAASWRYPKEEQFRFCPNCGRRLED
jgi:NADH pyrophosphatase NudC (nudix superfamily)